MGNEFSRCVAPNTWRLGTSECIQLMHRTYARNNPFMMCLERNSPPNRSDAKLKAESQLILKEQAVGTIVKISYQCAYGHDEATLQKVSAHEWYLWVGSKNGMGAILVSTSQLVCATVINAHSNGVPSEFDINIGKIVANNKANVFWILPDVIQDKPGILLCKVNQIWILKPNQ